MNAKREGLRGLLLVLLAVFVLLYSTFATATPQTNDRVVLNVTVTTKKDGVISDLTGENFSVTTDKRPQTILSFNAGVPASIGILIDTSGSLHTNDKKVMARLKQNLKAGLERFVELGHPDNEYFVMTFNQGTDLLQDWTSDPRSVLNKLDSMDFKGQTALYDAMIEAIQKLVKGRQTRHVLILVSDAEDSYSRNHTKHVREALKKSDVVLYAVGVLSVVPAEFVFSSPDARDVLEEFTSDSGGRHFLSMDYSKSGTFTAAFELIALELKSQYQLIINAEDPAAREKWRKLSVTVTRNDPSGKPQKLIVRTRKGYYR